MLVSSKLDDFKIPTFSFRSQLVQKQSQLHELLAESHKEAQDSEDTEAIIEEYLDEDFQACDKMEVEVLSLPTGKNIKNPSGSSEIIKLIEDIEVANQKIINSPNIQSIF